MCVLLPCIPIFRGGGGLMHIKKCTFVIMLEIAFLLVKMYFFSFNKDISELVA